MSVQINREEWLAALKDAGLHHDDDPNSLTVAEFADMMGLKRTSANRRLQQLVDVGKAATTKKRISDSQGRVVVVTAYRLT